MVCTYCGADTQVVNSRHQRRANSVWRRRACLQCQRIFSTVEQLDYIRSWTVRLTGGNHEPFIRDKLLLSIHKCLQHRPSALPDSIALTATIVGDLGKIKQNSDLNPTIIATLSMRCLQRFDTVAATMYGAYHAGVL